MKIMKLAVAFSTLLFHFFFLLSPSQAESVPCVSGILNEIQSLTESLGDDIKIEILPTAAFLYAQLGNTKNSHRLFQKTSDLVQASRIESTLPSRLGYLAKLQTQAHGIRDSKATIHRFLNLLKQQMDAEEEISWQMITILKDVATVQGRLGDVNGARSTLTYLQHLTKKKKLIFPQSLDLDLADTYLELGELNASRKLVHQSLTNAKTLPSGHWVRKYLLQQLPRILAKLGEDEELESVLQSLDQISDDHSIEDQKKYLYAHLDSAEGLWKIGKQKRGNYYLQTARTLALEMNDKVFKEKPRYASEIWSRIAVTEAKLGFIEQALNAETRIPLEELQGYALLPILKRHLEKREFQKVHTITQDAPTHILLEIIIPQVNAGDARGAIRSFEILHRKLDAQKMLPKYFPPDYAKVHHSSFLLVLQAVGRARVNAWGADSALNWAQSQNAPDLKAFALLGVAEGIINDNRELGESKYELAIQTLTQKIDEGIAGYTGTIGRAKAFYKLGRYDEALDDASTAIATNPDVLYGYTLRAAIYDRMGHVDLGIKDLTKGITLEPKNGLLYYLRSLGYLELEKPNRALNDLRKAIALGENFPEIYYTRGVALLNAGKYQDALVDYSKVLESQPFHYKSLMNRGLTYYCLGEFGKAIQDFSTILNESPMNLKAHLSRGYVYLDIEKYDMALKDFSHGINHDLANSYFYTDLAHIYQRLGKYPKAIEANHKAITLSRDNLAKADSYLQQGLLLLIQGKYAAALTAFSEGISYSDRSANSEALDWVVEEIRIWNSSRDKKDDRAEEIIKKIQNAQHRKQSSARQNVTNTCATPRSMWIMENRKMKPTEPEP